MYRSINTNRVYDDDYQSIYNQSPTSKSVTPVLKALSMEANEQSEYESSIIPGSASKKEKARNDFSQKAVHIIPFILLFCAFFLWIFSNPDIELPMRNDVKTEKVEGKERTDHRQGTDTVDMGLHKHDTHKLASTMANL